MEKRANKFPQIMKSVAVITGAATLVLTVLYARLPLDWLLTAAISLGTTCFHFGMRLAVGRIIPPLVRNVSWQHRWFQPQKWEAGLYSRLNVKNWKGKLPTYDPGQFDLRENSLEQVIQNTCGAEVVHEVIILCSFVPLLFSLAFGAFPVFLLTSLAAALYDSIFVIAQRYNRPRLVRILEKRSPKTHA